MVFGRVSEPSPEIFRHSSERLPRVQLVHSDV